MDNNSITEEYFCDDAKKLRALTDSLLRPFYGAYDGRDIDDIYSLAGMVFASVIAKYEPSQGCFEKYFATCLSNRIKDYFTKKNRLKRNAYFEKENGELIKQETISLNQPINPEKTDSEEMIDCVPARVEGIESNGQAEIFMDRLSPLGKKIAKLITMGYEIPEIQEMLGIKKTDYVRETRKMRTPEMYGILKRSEGRKTEVKKGAEEEHMAMATMEKSKTVTYTIESIARKLGSTLRTNHPLQRYPSQWSSEIRDNFIADILHNNPFPEIILAEQYFKTYMINWVLDGCQRTTTAVNFRNNLFTLGRKKIERPIVKYMAMATIDGEDVMVEKEFDIRGKKYKQLPKELQARFDDYNFRAVLYFNCSAEDIEYHIRRYNRSKPMNQIQKAITYIGEDYGRMIKKIAAHDFFRNNTYIKQSAINKGNLDKTVMDALMLIYFPDDWKKDARENAEFLRNNLEMSHVEEFMGLLDELDDVIEGDTYKYFADSNAYQFIGLFKRFVDGNIAENQEFNDFLAALEEEMDAFKGSASRDKKVVLEKLDFLTTKMKEHFGLEDEKEIEVTSPAVSEYLESFKKQEYVRRLTGSKAELTRAALRSLYVKTEDLSDEELAKETDVKPDEEQAVMDSIDTLDVMSLDVDNMSKILNVEYLPSVLKIITYGKTKYNNDELLLEWFVAFVKKFDAGIKKFGHSVTENVKTMTEDMDDFFVGKAA